MPTIFRRNGFRYYFYSHEPNEPPHVHVDKAGSSAKFWLDPVSLARNLGYPAKDLRVIADSISANQGLFLEAWYGYFGNGSR